VREAGNGLRLALEPHRVGGRAQELDRDGSIELEIVRGPDLGHRSEAETPLQAIAAADDLARHPFPMSASGRG
jgi:hypothetical protein